MATQKPTPEEKLFAVIQGAAHPPLRKGAKAVSLRRMGAQVWALVGPFDLPRVNQVLFVMAGALGLWGVAEFFMRPDLGRLMARATQHAAPFTMPPPLEGIKLSEEYIRVVTQQDPFGTEAALRGQSQSTQAATPAKPNYQAELADLRLVGVSWGAEPTAMIEQRSTQQTQFLAPGSTVGPFTIKKILPDRVILHAGDQDVELF